MFFNTHRLVRFISSLQHPFFGFHSQIQKPAMAPRPFQRHRTKMPKTPQEAPKPSTMSKSSVSTKADVNEYQVNHIIAKRVDMVRSIEQGKSPVLLQALQQELERRVTSVQWINSTTSRRSKSNKFAFPLTKQVRQLLHEHYQKAYDQDLSSVERRPSIDCVMGIIKAIDAVIGQQDTAKKKLKITIHCDNDDGDEAPAFVKKMISEPSSHTKIPSKNVDSGSGRLPFGALGPNTVTISKKTSAASGAPQVVKKPPPPSVLKKVNTNAGSRQLPFGTLGPNMASSRRTSRGLVTTLAAQKKPPPPPSALKMTSWASRGRVPFESTNSNSISQKKTTKPGLSFHEFPLPKTTATPHNTPVLATISRKRLMTTEKKKIWNYASSDSVSIPTFSNLSEKLPCTTTNAPIPNSSRIHPVAHTPFSHNVDDRFVDSTPGMNTVSNTPHPSESLKRKLESLLVPTPNLGGRLAATREATMPPPAFRNTSSMFLTRAACPTSLDPWSSLGSVTFSPIKKARRTSSGRSISGALDTIDEKQSSSGRKDVSSQSVIIRDGVGEEITPTKAIPEKSHGEDQNSVGSKCPNAKSDGADPKPVISKDLQFKNSVDTSDRSENNPVAAAGSTTPTRAKTCAGDSAEFSAVNSHKAKKESSPKIKKDLEEARHADLESSTAFAASRGSFPPIPRSSTVAKYMVLSNSAKLSEAAWPVEDDYALRKAICEIQTSNASWVAIAEILGGKYTANQCKQRWLRALYLGSTKRWDSTEDVLLINEMSKEPPVSWSEIATKLPGRASIEVLERYLRHLDPSFLPGMRQKYEWIPLMKEEAERFN
jgi:hypothetical protein